MPNKKNIIITIDISTNMVKVGFVTSELELDSFVMKPYAVRDEDSEGFAKSIDMDDLWEKLISCIKHLLEKYQSDDLNIIGISSCAARIATVFLDKNGSVIKGCPNVDLRGIDSAYLIEDEFSEEELFKITGHNPSLLFGLARLLWFQEEAESEEFLYPDIDKFLMLDDWIILQLTGKLYSDYSSASDSQLFDIKEGKWSNKVIKAFNFDLEIFPDIIESGEIVGMLKPELKNILKINQNDIPIIKSGGDTQASLIGMGVIEVGQVGITLGSTAPVHLVLNEPLFDQDQNFWTTHHSIKGEFLIEANTGKTGEAYNWFKEAFLENSGENPDDLIEKYLDQVEPGGDSTFAFLGPQLMDFKNQSDIKRGVFIFQPPTAISKDLPKIQNFARAVIENICFGILENHKALSEFTNHENRTYCAGGMAKSEQFCNILANILNKDVIVPPCKDSAFIGLAINTLVGLKLYPDHKNAIQKLIKFKIYKPDPVISKKYESLYREWKGFKRKIDEL